STSTRTGDNTKKTSITCGYRRRAAVHRRLHLQLVQRQHLRLQLLQQQLPHLLLLPRPDRRRRRGVVPRRRPGRKACHRFRTKCFWSAMRPRVALAVAKMIFTEGNEENKDCS